jgi:hypothetical protein
MDYGLAAQEIEDLEKRRKKEKDPKKREGLQRQINDARRKLPSHW